jgi:hypothetical protein
MFAIFTWYTTQQADAAKASIEAHTGAVRNEISSKDANIRTQLASDIAQNQAEISGLKALVDRRATQDSDYQSFKALVTAQNATSIIEQTDKGKLIGDMQTGLSGLTKDVAAITARADQKFASIETQFYAYGQMRNIQFSDQQRINAMHQNSLHDLGAKLPEYPVGPFYQPNISNPAGF